ncbi:LysR family transcriptional regulator [Poseidonocella sp. HB161398]|uniref:LysR family transcriptional regulator n=1 Tax=Poseidonocella sp. HB161398 TaxID=2320855 RepID=UPI00110823A7|nr:LysR family transcriptional regulator [Poseidonocella sp. HB161398]
MPRGTAGQYRRSQGARGAGADGQPDRSGGRSGITVAVASKRLQRLEAVLGVRFADRSARAVRLSRDGQSMPAECRHAVDRVEDAVQGRAGGVVRISAAVAFAQRQIAPLLPGFLHAHPGIRVEIEASNRRRTWARRASPSGRGRRWLRIRRSAGGCRTGMSWSRRRAA